jgi:hypothetical protein
MRVFFAPYRHPAQAYVRSALTTISLQHKVQRLLIVERGGATQEAIAWATENEIEVAIYGPEKKRLGPKALPAAISAAFANGRPEVAIILGSDSAAGRASLSECRRFRVPALVGDRPSARSKKIRWRLVEPPRVPRAPQPLVG